MRRNGRNSSFRAASHGRKGQDMLKGVVINIEKEDLTEIAGIEIFTESLGMTGVKIKKQSLEEKGAVSLEPGEQPNEWVMIADSMKGVRAASKAGIPCIGYQKPGPDSEYLQGVLYIIEGFEEIDSEWVNNVYKRSRGEPWTIAETDRLIIREMTLDDVDDLWKLYEDPEITRYMDGLSGDRGKETELMAAYIKMMYGFFEYGLWAVVEKSTGRLAGRAGLSNRETEDGMEVELGYMVGLPFQKQGYAYEACTAVLDYAKNILCLDRIACYIREGNIPSIRLAKKLGFRLRGKTENGDTLAYEIELV